MGKRHLEGLRCQVRARDERQGSDGTTRSSSAHGQQASQGQDRQQGQGIDEIDGEPRKGARGGPSKDGEAAQHGGVESLHRRDPESQQGDQDQATGADEAASQRALEA
ncbi:MAG TPA: hypothetical protein VII45_07795 [Solirubrobacterales bacterium]